VVAGTFQTKPFVPFFEAIDETETFKTAMCVERIDEILSGPFNHLNNTACPSNWRIEAVRPPPDQTTAPPARKVVKAILYDKHGKRAAHSGPTPAQYRWIDDQLKLQGGLVFYPQDKYTGGLPKKAAAVMPVTEEGSGEGSGSGAGRGAGGGHYTAESMAKYGGAHRESFQSREEASLQGKTEKHKHKVKTKTVGKKRRTGRGHVEDPSNKSFAERHLEKTYELDPVTSYAFDDLQDDATVDSKGEMNPDFSNFFRENGDDIADTLSSQIIKELELDVPAEPRRHRNSDALSYFDTINPLNREAGDTRDVVSRKLAALFWVYFVLSEITYNGMNQMVIYTIMHPIDEPSTSGAVAIGAAVCLGFPAVIMGVVWYAAPYTQEDARLRRVYGRYSMWWDDLSRHWYRANPNPNRTVAHC